MEITELNTIGLPENIPESFCTKFSDQTGLCVLLRSNIHSFRFTNSQLFDDHTVNVEATILDCPDNIPSNEIKLELRNMFENAPMEGRLELLLNNTLIPRLTSTGPTIRLIAMDLSPVNIFDDQVYVLALNNFGELAVFAYQTSDSRQITHARNWIQIHSITKIWLNYIQSTTRLLENEISTYEKLKSTANDIVISSMCWKDCLENDNRYIASSTRSNIIILLKCPSSNNHLKITLCQLIQCNSCDEIQSLKWISISANISLIIAACADGRIILFSVIEESMSETFEIKRLSDLWSETDGLPIVNICTHIDKSTEVLFVLAIKTSNLLIFMIEIYFKSQTFRTLQFQSYTFDHYKISGITKLMDMKYLICSPNCYAEMVEIQIDDESHFSLKLTTVNLGIDPSTWRINGVESSRNKCLLFFIADIAVVSSIVHFWIIIIILII